MGINRVESFKIKKGIALLLLACVLLGLCACGNDNGNNNQSTQKDPIPVETIPLSDLFLDLDNGAKAQMNVGKATLVYGEVRNISSTSCTIDLFKPKDGCVSVEMSVEQLASSCFVSSSKIKKIFTKFVGCGAAEYFNFMKIARAKLQLNKGLSVLEVSEEFGFSNQFYFSSVFKKVTGMTPSEFRNLFRVSSNEIKQAKSRSPFSI